MARCRAARWEAHIAWSAWRSSASGVAASAGYRLIPMLAPTTTGWCGRPGSASGELEQRDRRAEPVGATGLHDEVLAQLRTVGQAGQRVVLDQVVGATLGLDPLGDVVLLAHVVRQHPPSVAHRQQLQVVPERAALEAVVEQRHAGRPAEAQAAAQPVDGLGSLSGPCRNRQLRPWACSGE